MGKAAPHQHGPGGHGRHAGRDKHEGHSSEMFRDKFWLSFLLTLPVVYWSAHVQMLLGYRAPEFSGSAWIPPVLATAVFLYGGLIFLRGAFRELRARPSTSRSSGR